MSYSRWVRFFTARVGWLALTLALLSGSLMGLGCTTEKLAEAVVRPPNHDVPVDEAGVLPSSLLSVIGVDQTMRIMVGPPEAVLTVWIMHPRGAADATSSGEAEPVHQQAAPPARGVILVLHGITGGPLSMTRQGRELADRGYRAVVVGLRGYGRSTGEHRTFGVFERRDLSQVLDVLQEQGLADDRIGVLGMSYGAAMAMELAGHDDRVQAVVAMAGFSSFREIAPHIARRLLPFVSRGPDGERVQTVVDLAGESAGFDPSDASAVDAMARTRAKVLIVHGKLDAIVPFDHAERLAQAGNADTELMAIPFAGHFTTWLDPDGRIRDRAADWFDQWLTDQPRYAGTPAPAMAPGSPKEPRTK